MKTSIAILAALLAGGPAALSLTHASAQGTSTPAPQASPGCPAQPATFKASVGADRKLMVTGQLRCPTTSWNARLVKAAPQGPNPAILILEAQTMPPRGMAGEMVTDVDVKFEEPNGAAFKQVTIRGAVPDFTLKVGQAAPSKPH